MEFRGEYRISAPRERVWDLLLDPAVLRECIPGCEELVPVGDSGFAATVVAKVGPVKARFNGTVELLNLAKPVRYEISGSGQGGIAGAAKGRAQVELEERDGGSTALKYAVDAQITGKLAQLGARLINGVAAKLADNFFEKLAASVTSSASQDTLRQDVVADPGPSPYSPVGQSVRRVEDRRFLTGHGLYVDDIPRDQDAVAHFVRSPIANGRIIRIDTTEAAAAPGILAVYTHDDLRQAGIGRIPCVFSPPSSDGRPMFDPGRPGLADGYVRFVGDPVAVIVGETEDACLAAADLVSVEYEELPSVTELGRAVEPGAPVLWPEAQRNVSFVFEEGRAAEVDSIFSSADHVVRLPLVNNRIAISPVEPRAVHCRFDLSADQYVLHSPSQGVHELRGVLAKNVFRIEPERIRVITPDVGGSFGMKIMAYPEHVCVMFAARALGQPVRWTGTRSEAFLSDYHGRDHKTIAELALDKDGRFLALRVDTLANLGAYIAQTGAMIPTLVYCTVFGGCYRIPAVHVRVRGIFTNQPSTDAYRGAGVPESIYLLERLVDVAAHEIGIDRITLRRRNLIRPDELPYRTAIGQTYDVGDFPGILESALLEADWSGFSVRREVTGARGRLRGIGLSCYIHGTGGYPNLDHARAELTPDGHVIVYCGAMQTGQGHETAFRQLVAARLALPLTQIEVREGDSSDLPDSGGTGGSSSMVVAARSVIGAVDIMLDNARQIASDLLEASVSDIEYLVGTFKVAGSDLQVTLAEVAARALAVTSGAAPGCCAGDARFSGEPRTFPYGVHICELEVDPETGDVEISQYTAIDDLGVVVNPMIAEGQIHGGVAQGIGQALLEKVHYDTQTGQLLSGSLTDYTLPRADNMPLRFVVRQRNIPSKNNALGMKGVGEIGTIAAPPAVINAVCDAIGARHIDMPATVLDIWRVINAREGEQRGREANGPRG